MSPDSELVADSEFPHCIGDSEFSLWIAVSEFKFHSETQIQFRLQRNMESDAFPPTHRTIPSPPGHGTWHYSD